MPQKPSPHPLEAEFPPVAIHAPRREVSTHPWFAGARSGDVDAAALLVADTCSGAAVDWLGELGSGKAPLLVAVLAHKAEGLNVLPEVLAQGLHLLLGWEIDTELVQASVVHQAGAAGFNHVARQPLFTGAVEAGRAYVLVDDFIGQGATVASLRGHISAGGGRVLGATVLTGSAALSAVRLEPGPRRLKVRDEPGLSVGAFVVELPRLDAGPEPGLLSAAHIERLRAAKRIIRDRARAILMLRTTLPPPQYGSGSAP